MDLQRIGWHLIDAASFLKDVILPFVTLVVAAIVLAVAYRLGLLRQPRQGVDESPRLVIGDYHIGDISIGSNLQEIALDASKVDEYHRQSIAQARISFWFSLVFASLGFLIIATSVVTYSDKTGYLGIVAGTIIDAIAALFFYQSNRARRLMAEFFDRLRADRKLQESLKLCADVQDSAVRDALRAKLSLHFSGLDRTDESLTVILARRSAPPEASGPAEAPDGHARDKAPANEPLQRTGSAGH